MSKKITMKIEIGKTYRLYVHNGSYKCHVLAIVEGHIVFRYYGVHKQWWHYFVLSRMFFEHYFNMEKEMHEKL